MASTRLMSLDVLRGLDMLLLTAVGPVVLAVQAGWNCFPEGFVRQFDHGWECFTLWDIIMPLFIFMCGAAMPLALEKRLSRGRGVFWRHVLSRVALLWFLGCLVQGRLITLDPLRMSPYSNTLQSIAFGYLVVATVMSLGSRVMMFAVPIALTVGYALLLAVGGDYTQYGNLAFRIDHAILGWLLPAENEFVKTPSYYTWFLTSAMFATMTFVGYHATQILRLDRPESQRVALLGGYGIGLLAVGCASEPWIPCIKPIYTLSFTAQAMGWCVLLLDVLYVLTDVLQVRRGLAPAVFFGRLALCAYFVSHFFRTVLASLAHLLGDGLVTLLPKSAAPLVICLLTVASMVFVMFMWRCFKLSMGTKSGRRE